MTLANTVKKALRESGIEVVSCRKSGMWGGVQSFAVTLKSGDALSFNKIKQQVIDSVLAKMGVKISLNTNAI